MNEIQTIPVHDIHLSVQLGQKTLGGATSNPSPSSSYRHKHKSLPNDLN